MDRLSFFAPNAVSPGSSTSSDVELGALRGQVTALRARLEGVLDATLDAMIVIDESGTVEVFNKAAERMFGYEAGRIIGNNVSLLMPSPHRELHDRYLADYLHTGVRRIIGRGREVEALRADGTVFPVDIGVGEVAIPGERRYFIGTLRDISARKALERSLKDQRGRMAETERLTTLGEIASGIAHEINQPLTAIATYAQVCKRLAAKPELDALTGALDQIGQQAQRAGDVIRRLRSFIQPRTQVPEPFSVNDLVASTLDLIEIDSLQGQVQMAAQLEAANALVNGDVAQIEQVVLHLLRNAIEAVGDAGRDDPRVEICTRNHDGSHVVVEISDNGPGVDPLVAREFFTPFVTTKNKNAGLGLAISYSIVSAHSGRLTYAPGSSGGSRFAFTLPVIDATDA